MTKFERDNPDMGSGGRLGQYRLHPGAFYFKLCPSVVFEPLSSELIRGMYLPLDYWQHLASSRRVVGPRGGMTVGFENVERYLSNTLFSQLVQHGWIGARTRTTKVLEQLVRALIEGNHSVVLADGREIDG